MKRILVGSSWIQSIPYRATNELGSAAATVTFSSIPTTLKRIKLLMSIRGDASSSGLALLRFNGDSGTNYRYQAWNAFTVGTSNTSGITQTSVPVCSFLTGAGAGDWAMGHVDIAGWNAPHATYLAGTAHGGYVFNTTGGSNNTNLVWAYLGSSGSGYTSITITQSAGNFQAGSQFLLEGWD